MLLFTISAIKLRASPRRELLLNHNSYTVYLKKKFVIVGLYISMFSIDTADNNDAIKQNGDKVEFSFNAMVYR